VYKSSPPRTLPPPQIIVPATDILVAIPTRSGLVEWTSSDNAVAFCFRRFKSGCNSEVLLLRPLNWPGAESVPPSITEQAVYGSDDRPVCNATWRMLTEPCGLLAVMYVNLCLPYRKAELVRVTWFLFCDHRNYSVRPLHARTGAQP